MSDQHFLILLLFDPVAFYPCKKTFFQVHAVELTLKRSESEIIIPLWGILINQKFSFTTRGVGGRLLPSREI